MSRSGKKGKEGLGRAILKERNRGKRSHSGGSWLHTSELNDGYDWNKLNLRSVTEEKQLDEFLRTAELAGTEFTAEKLNVRVVDVASSRSSPPSLEEERERERTRAKFRQYIGIPRRPEWSPTTTPEQLELAERESYLTWRRNLARVEEEGEGEGLVFTPFEKNLQFWRQLWRVVERSDIVVQIVDGRNPLLFRCEDLEKYVKELSDKKVNLLLISKADLLSRKQRLLWGQYFSEMGISAAFWSAPQAENEIQNVATTTTTTTTDESTRTESTTKTTTSVETTKVKEVRGNDDKDLQPQSDSEEGLVEKPERRDGVQGVCPDILSREGLLQLFMELSPLSEGQMTTVGLVGYPNVGKSSTINVLYQQKKVPVSATPGRTKHFQTLSLSDHLVLCDCPGLVFPSLLTTKAEMVVSGILPIDQMRDHTPPVSLVCQRVPRSILKRVYGLSLPQPSEGEDPGRCPTAQELLSAYGCLHGYMTSHGLPNCPRSARYILKDYVNGKLLFCHPPPGTSAGMFNAVGLLDRVQRVTGEGEQTADADPSVNEAGGNTAAATSCELSDFDKQFMQQERVRVISKGRHGVKGFTRKSDPNRHHSSAGGSGEGEGEGEGGIWDTESVPSSLGTGVGKPWKRHNNRNKKEKTRRTARPLNPHQY